MTRTTPDAEPVYSSLARDPDLRELVEMFVAEMPDRISAFQDAFESGNLDSLGGSAHQLKGSAGSYGFDTLTVLAAAVEFSVKEGKTEEEIQSALADLVSACQRATADVSR